MTTATHNGTTYRVIYTAEGDLWARDVITNPPKPPRRRKKLMGRPASLKFNIKTAVMVHQIGLKQTARHYGVTPNAVAGRIRRLEKWVGFRIFPSYGYTLLTYLGKQFIEFHIETNQ